MNPVLAVAVRLTVPGATQTVSSASPEVEAPFTLNVHQFRKFLTVNGTWEAVQLALGVDDDELQLTTTQLNTKAAEAIVEVRMGINDRPPCHRQARAGPQVA
jgi:hypothetical protein